MRFIGRREGVDAASCSSRWRWAEEHDGRQRPDHALRRVQLRRPGGDRRRRAHASPARPRRSSARHLYAPEMHDPDLIIRTSGEQRLSNYLLWQSAYSELCFTDVLWPDFSRADLEAALGGVRRPASAGSGGADGDGGARPRAPGRAPARRAPRRNEGSDLGAADRRRDPGDRVRDRDHRARRLVVRGRRRSRWASSACTSCSACTSGCSPVRLAAFLALIGLVVAAASSASGRGAARDRRGRSRWCSCSALAMPRAAGPVRDRARCRSRSSASFWIGLGDRPRDPAARAAARRRRHRRRARRHVHRRHRRLPRRAR